MPFSQRALFWNARSDAVLSRWVGRDVAKLGENPWAELAQWPHQISQLKDTDLHRICRLCQIEPQGIKRDLASAFAVLSSGALSLSDFSGITWVPL